MLFRSIFKSTLVLLFLFSIHSAFSQSLDVLQVVNSKGKKVSWKKVSKKMEAADVILFGEEHNCTMTHYLTLKLMKEWTRTDSLNKSFTLEMFERDQQAVIDSIQNGQIPFEDLEKHTRTWPNYSTDYAQFLALSLQKGMPIIAGNITRKYASMMFKQGLDALKALPEEEKAFICSLDFTVDKELSQYAALAEMAVHMGDKGKYFIEAQAIKDATMGESIVRELEKGNKVFQLNGSYHSDFQQGVLWYVKQVKPEVKSLTFSVVRQDVKRLPKEMKGKADFIFIIPSDFPVSY